MHHTDRAALHQGLVATARRAAAAMVAVTLAEPPKGTRKATRLAWATTSRRAANALLMAQGSIAAVRSSAWLACPCGSVACTMDARARVAGTVPYNAGVAF